MYYEINVALNGKHFFATADRSITDTAKLETVLKVIVEKFPASEGYSISVTQNTQTGSIIDFKKILSSDSLE